MIEMVQYRAANIVSGAIHCTSYNVVYSELRCEKLEDRQHKQMLFYKTIHEETLVYLQKIIPSLNVQNQYQLCNETNYPHPKTRTSNFRNSFLHKTVRDWKNTETDINMCDSLESFKTTIVYTSILCTQLVFNWGTAI